MRFVKLWISVIALFSVTAFGLTGCGGGGGGGTPNVPSGSVPGTPAGVAAAALNNTQVGLTWGAVTGATSYNVYWSTVAGLPKEQRTKIAGVTAPAFTHSNLQSGTKYYYLVTAVNLLGESAASAEVSATTTFSPSAVSATPANGQVTLKWPAVPGASSYNLYFSTSSNMIPASSTKVANANPAGQIVTPLTNGTEYFFEITAVINGVESDPSPIVSAVPSTTPAPAAPSNVVASSFLIGTPSITLNWGDVTNAASYNVYFSTTPNISKALNSGEFTNVQTTVTNGLKTFKPPVTDQANTTYYFIITAVAADGNESTASPVLKVIPPVFTQTMVSGKTGLYTDDTGAGTFTFVANANGTLTFTSTLPGVPAAGTGSWSIDQSGALVVLIPSGSLTFNYDIFQTTNNGNLLRVQFNNGSQSPAIGTMTFS